MNWLKRQIRYIDPEKKEMQYVWCWGFFIGCVLTMAGFYAGSWFVKILNQAGI